MSDEEAIHMRSSILFYQTEDGRQRIEVRLEEDTVWLTQRLMSELFQTTPENITMHLKNIFGEGELDPNSVTKESLVTARDGKNYRTKLYRLEVIIAVGYRIQSNRGTQFRQWATQRLQEYIVKGFTMDDERLSNPGGLDYFDELLERIRAIRASEKRFYQKIRDIYLLSADYDPKHPMTQEFFATVQNKLLFAVTGMTAAEIVHARADATKPNMGLSSWKGAGRGKILGRQDIEIAKNYMSREEIETLDLLVNQYIDFAELQTRSRKVMYMKDWKEKLNAFLQLNEREILTHAGKISADLAKELAHTQYEKYVDHRKFIESKLADEELSNIIQEITRKLD
ncbi:MAG TPA: virulence RhuM family protein [Rhabdochlamydiaceae bacterium]|nr:virulence RhuM family protein [Rhabdochlamydiaceae bacterium]